MAAMGIAKLPLPNNSVHPAHRKSPTPFLASSSTPRLSSSFHVSGGNDNILLLLRKAAIPSGRRTASGARTPVLVSPKAVSDSRSSQTCLDPDASRGTADAVRQYLWLFEEHNVMEFLILAGDHLYRMDYEKFIQAHRETNADITVAALPMDEKRATAFGLMKIDEEGRIIEFAEKPKGDQLKAMMVETLSVVFLDL
ncbi:hypothetical protein BHM03_00059288 [Ensete ventricosum]|nr:hypothetical protein BHM03_00059288 [Ensete ventricosum]